MIRNLNEPKELNPYAMATRNGEPIGRIYGAAPGSGNPTKDNYYGERYTYLYKGNYNFNLDNSIVFGLERENDKIGYNKDMTGLSIKNAYVNSAYFDFQKTVQIMESIELNINLRIKLLHQGK